MDNFMNKLSQRIGAQDTIKANFMADTAEKEQLRKQLEDCSAMLQSVRNLYLKQEENSELFVKLAAKLESINADFSENPAVLQELKECISRSDEFTHKECVKVYRNVQALLDEQNAKFVESTGTLNAQVTALRAHLDSMKIPDTSVDLAAIKSVAQKAASSARSNKIWLVLTTLIGVANLACMLLIHFGLL